ncbi:MAG: alpha-amylase family glycosyl hydrolase [Ignavibacteria bacterium]|nr:alpha-amylase family glycosyl hydrolase [Ignavibacteria bacterium]
MIRFISTVQILIISCFSFGQPLHDIIKPIRLQSGFAKEILISDIFYSPNYDVNFPPNKLIEVVYSKEDKTLKLTPNKEAEGFLLLPFNIDKTTYQTPVLIEKKISHLFKYQTDKEVKKVNLFGSFNHWNRENLPMNKVGDFYEIEISLEPGRYEYKFSVDGDEVLDNTNPIQLPNGLGGYNSILTLTTEKKSELFLHILNKVQSEPGFISFNFELESNPKIEKLSNENIIALIDNTVIDKKSILIDKNRIQINFKSSELKGNKTIRIVYSENGAVSNKQTIRLYDGIPAGNKNSLDTWNDAVIYSLMIDRFFDGDPENSIPVNHPDILKPANYQGGDLLGLIKKLEEGYFDSLGINAMWISPVNDNTNEAFMEYPPPHRYYSGYHGYWPIHHERVEEKFGTMELLKEFIAKAHQRGIKILLDFVANHVHIEHPFWKEHRDWFGVLELPDGKKNLRLWDEQRLTTWFEPYMPSFDYVSSTEALEVMTDNAVWWLKETKADGFRHDAVKHVPNEFWRLLTEKIKREIEVSENKIVYQIGETFGSYELVSSYVNNGQLSAQFNFNLYDTAIPVFTKEGESFVTLDEQMFRTFSVYGENHVMGNVVDSHDKVRFIAYADGDIKGDPGELAWTNPPTVDHKSSYDKLKLHLAFILSIPGIPVIYYGDEIGMTGASDPDNRRMMRFGSELSEWETETLQDVKKIVNVRKSISSLRHGDFKTLQADENLYVYIRSDLNDRVIVALNKSALPQKIKINLPTFYSVKSAEDIFSKDKVEVKNNELNLTIPAIGYKFIILK